RVSAGHSRALTAPYSTGSRRGRGTTWSTESRHASCARGERDTVPDMDQIRTRRVTIYAAVAGILCAVIMIPAYAVGSPEFPGSPDAAAAYYEQASFFVAVNGIVPLLHLLLFLIFVAGFVAVVQSEVP